MDAMKMKEELERGMEAANQLSVLLGKSRGKEQYTKEALRVSRDNHPAMIIKSFDTALSMVRNAQSKQLSDLNKRSECYNITRQPLRPMTVTAELKEDGYTWRKYGQKSIVNSKHPREYFRCGLKDQGCQATKKVQVISSNPTRYKIVYYGQHSCQNYQILGDEFAQDSPYMLSFGCSTNSKPKSKAKSKSRRLHSDDHSVSSSLMIQEENKPATSQDKYFESSPDDLAIMNQLPETPFPVDFDMLSSMYTHMSSATYFEEEDYSHLVADYNEFEPDNGFLDIQLWD